MVGGEKTSPYPRAPQIACLQATSLVELWLRKSVEIYCSKVQTRCPFTILIKIDFVMVFSKAKQILLFQCGRSLTLAWISLFYQFGIWSNASPQGCWLLPEKKWGVLFVLPFLNEVELSDVENKSLKWSIHSPAPKFWNLRLSLVNSPFIHALCIKNISHLFSLTGIWARYQQLSSCSSLIST